MKWVILIVFIALAISVLRRARACIQVGLWLALLFFVIAGCATERPSPGPAPNGQLCTHGGEYVFVRCPR